MVYAGGAGSKGGGGRSTGTKSTYNRSTTVVEPGGTSGSGSRLGGGPGMETGVLETSPNFAGKTGGRLGNTSTRLQIDQIATELESRGYTIEGGGLRLPEEYLKPTGGGRKGGSYPDITATHPKYGTLRINTVDVYKNGLPTIRELNNATRIRIQIGPGQHLLLIPKK